MPWDFTASEVLAAWPQAVAAEGLQESMGAPYQTWHEGALHDLLKSFRDEAGVCDRGHWASPSSARIYRKPARVQKLVSGPVRGQLEQAQGVAARYAVWCRSGTCPRAVGRRAVAPPVDGQQASHLGVADSPASTVEKLTVVSFCRGEVGVVATLTWPTVIVMICAARLLVQK